MKLFYQTHSPYARKVLVLAHELGIAGDIDVIHHETSPTNRNEEVFGVNPLGKVPVLICANGLTLFDSNVIAEYLDGLHRGRRYLPTEGRARWLCLRMQAVAQGIADAGILARWDTERRPPALRWQTYADGQLEKLNAAFDYLEEDATLDGAPDLGQVAAATALSWIEFRSVAQFKAGRPRLARWYERFVERPSMRATDYSGDTHD